MAKLAIKKASTDVTTYIFIQDSSKTTGEGLAGLAYNTGSLVGYYVRPKGSATAITLATQTVTGDHSDGGFVEIDATNMPGVYRLDLPDAVCATGVPSVVVMLKGATNMSPVVLEIQLTDFDLNDASPNVTVADMATDSITAASVKADAVTKLQANLALEATLTAIKAKTDNLPADPADDSDIDAQLAAIKAETALIVEDTGTTIPATITTIDNEIAVIDGIVDAILDDTGTTGVLLSTSALTSIFDDETIVGTYTFSDLLKIMAAALAGKATGGGTTTVTFRGVDDTSDVIVATVDANGNRSAVTLTV